MNKRIAVFISVILLAVAGGIIFLLINENEEEVKDSVDTSQNTKQQETKPTETATRNGKYVVYSEDIIATTTGDKYLFFHAPWCPQCLAIEDDIESMGVVDNKTIIKVDYDSNQTLRKQYGVTLQTTFVEVGDNGELLETYVAYDTPTLQAVEENIILN